MEFLQVQQRRAVRQYHSTPVEATLIEDRKRRRSVRNYLVSTMTRGFPSRRTPAVPR